MKNRKITQKIIFHLLRIYTTEEIIAPNKIGAKPKIIQPQTFGKDSSQSQQGKIGSIGGLAGRKLSNNWPRL